MRKFRLLALICAAVMLVTSLSSCGYELVLRKKGEGETTTVPAFTTQPYVPVPPATEIPTAPPAPSAPSNNFIPDDSPGLQVDKVYNDMSMAPADVIELYTRAMNDVKLRCPGYTRTLYQDVSDVKTTKGGDKYMVGILNALGDSIREASGDTSESLQIMAHDDVAVRETFPLFNQELGCDCTDMSIVQFANCYTDGQTYKIVISFTDQLNPSSVSSPFARVMTPVDRSEAGDEVRDYMHAMKLNSYDFDLEFVNCEITCYIDKASSRMVSLQQKMILNAELSMCRSLYLFDIGEVEAEGSLVNRLEYYNFDWS